MTDLKHLYRLAMLAARRRVAADEANSRLRAAIAIEAGSGVSYDDIAAVCGITKQRVEQIVRRERNGASGKTGGRPPKVKTDA